MKIFTLILTGIAIALIIFNVTKINFEAPFEDDSIVALITIACALCAVVLLQILRISKKIERKQKTK
ncbi:membrane protein [Mangrovimonas yunxiaonensis]|uniref:Membrane protein n=1 Tax=Mangrovimonas yunxiaonensis TaxID=1197477 RepID=A0A084TMN6_9FLAO|nr:hypothetical protein [Mangrovimonas yunxiaonensis]KFB01972.1 membrane protein [Mangrovimonas yunxiaonensis]MBR9757622.1 hypothetical protein [Algicola sp.]GGH45073.1 hypothetical protein GCM10011364_18250 [Mangrovimonas yunxiaonensis]